MSNLFILIKCRKYVPDSVMRKISPFATRYNFLWIGGNSIKNYHTHQYRGPTKKLKSFKKEVNNILHKSKLQYSMISGNKGYLDKPSEHDFSVYQGQHKVDLNSIFKDPKRIVKEKLYINKKYLFRIISKLNKTKCGYYLPISLSSTIKEHPIKVSYDVFIIFDDENISLYSENKYALRSTKLWLTRLSKLYKKFN